MPASKDRLELMQGTLDVLVLKTLSPGAAHGFAVMAEIRRRTDGAFDIEEGALYHALHRLERRGFIASEWGVSDNNRRAKYYRLTSEGRGELRREVKRWSAYTRAVMAVLEGA
jgi:PadR family transcriptional regulator, regulatory protein PadR